MVDQTIFWLGEEADDPHLILNNSKSGKSTVRASKPAG
jgi:hypothetical protein